MPLPRFHRLPLERRDQILDAAAEEFGAHGYSAASMNRIIEAAGLSKGAMYYAFDGKADLWATLVDSVFAQLGPLDEAFGVTETPEQFWVAFRGMYDQALAVFGRSPRVAHMMRAMTRSTQIEEAMHVVAMAEGMGVLRESFARIIAQGRSIGAVRDDLEVDQLIDVVLALNTITDRWLALAHEQDASQLGALLDTVVDLNVRLLRAEP